MPVAKETPQRIRPGNLIIGIVLLVFLVIAAGCLGPCGWGPPTQNETYSPAELKYILLDHYNKSRFFYCNPDVYPVSQGDELEKAIAIFPAIQNNSEEFNAIVERTGLRPPFSNESNLIIYHEYKILNAIQLSPATTTSYEFGLRIQTPTGGMQVSGIIRTDGVIIEEHTEPAVLTCPVCLSKGTLIDTPDGPVRVEELRTGMLIWTTDSSGSRTAAPVLLTGTMPVFPGHWLVHIMLSDGREIAASARHPTTDSRSLGMLRPGDELDGAVVISANTIMYDEGYTCDILPAGETGSYRANGIPLSSTLV